MRNILLHGQAELLNSREGLQHAPKVENKCHRESHAIHSQFDLFSSTTHVRIAHVTRKGISDV